MKKAAYLALMMCTVGSANAGCPASLNGNWGGTITTQTDGIVFGADGNNTPLHSAADSVLTVTFSGATATPTFYSEAQSGVFGEATTGTNGAGLTVAYTRASCNGTLTGDGNNWTFVLTDNGKTLHGVSFRGDKGKIGEQNYQSGDTRLMTLTRQ